MSEYECFNCKTPTHTSELDRVEWKGLVSLLCRKCIERIFVEGEQKK